jgi:hypothetical protein
LRKVISGRITFTPVTGTDRAYYRVEWLGCFGALLAEELEALSLARPTSASASFIGGDPGGIRTRDLDLERVASLARLDDGVPGPAAVARKEQRHDSRPSAGRQPNEPI